MDTSTRQQRVTYSLSERTCFHLTY